MPNDVGAVLVIGGGIGGIQSALDLANSGFKVYLLEKKPSIGGVMAQLDKTFPTNDCSMCIMSPKMVDVGRHPNIELLTYSELESIEGEAGNFTVTVKQKARYVNKNCTGCGSCAEVCRLKGRIDDEYDAMLGKRGAIYVPFPQAVPLQYTIDPDRCIYLTTGKCGDSPPCKKVCGADAIDHEQNDEYTDLAVGSIILSTGFQVFDPHRIPEYGFGTFKNVITSLQLERLQCASGPPNGHILRPSDGKAPRRIAFIQCVGSRDHRTNTYCSSVCCAYAIKEAIVAREHSPQLESTIFAMDA
ncbi:MAG: CoB--CoM heterodisulfide reductase iron-sulfur subunit A family protein, partial [Deltaproteobacteria bacterium]|nr:CoB--CoM heterodisulfide reductase iron-sulfur subunit A family protein [Deltaproteobacteria bacterium]